MNKTLTLAFMLCLTTTHTQPAEFLKSDAAQAIQVGALIGAGMGVLKAAGEHTLLQYALANAKQNLHLINAVDGVQVTCVDLVGRGFFQKNRVTIENKMLFKAIVESELVVLEHMAHEPVLSRVSKTLIQHIGMGGFMGLVSSFVASGFKAHGINSLEDFVQSKPGSESYQKEMSIVTQLEQVKANLFGKKTEYKTLLAAWMSLVGTVFV